MGGGRVAPPAVTLPTTQALPLSTRFFTLPAWSSTSPGPRRCLSAMLCFPEVLVHGCTTRGSARVGRRHHPVGEPDDGRRGRRATGLGAPREPDARPAAVEAAAAGHGWQRKRRSHVDPRTGVGPDFPRDARRPDGGDRILDSGAGPVPRRQHCRPSPRKPRMLRSTPPGAERQSGYARQGAHPPIRSCRRPSSPARAGAWP